MGSLNCKDKQPEIQGVDLSLGLKKYQEREFEDVYEENEVNTFC